jgi:protease-4
MSRRWLALLLCAGTCGLVPANPFRVGVPAAFCDELANANAVAENKLEKKRVNYAHIELKGSFPEGAALPGLFGDVEETLPGILDRLRKAAEDDRLHGVIIHINGPRVGWGKVHELRQAIARLRRQGKKTFAWLESGSLSDYLIACSCEQVVVPESGMLMLPGLRAEVTFYKKLFDWLEIQPQMLRVGEYKSAAEPFTRAEMSEEFREELQELLDGFYEQAVSQIADSRRLSPDEVRAAIDVGLLTAAQARDRGLVDHVAYEDQITRLIQGGQDHVQVRITKGYGKQRVDTDFSGLNGFLKLMNLLMGVEEPERRSNSPKIAVISAVGPIITGASQADLFGEGTVGSSTMIKAIRRARDDDTVKAIVLRVDSPGGSALASDLIWHELKTVQKPVVVSMGDVAASGGYYIAMGADRIFAEPGTITGSIGVVGGKLALERFMAKFGITHSIVQRGKNSGVLSVTTPFTADEQAVLQGLLDEIYRQFTTKAAEGRRMDVDRLEKLARGRIYTGQKAQALGLVDELGTLDDAVAYAQTAAGIAPDVKLERLQLPKPVNPFEALFGSPDTETRAARTLLQRLPETLQEPLQHLSVIDLLAREPVLTILPFQLRIR